jgi:hypothetical protein
VIVQVDDRPYYQCRYPGCNSMHLKQDFPFDHKALN